MVVSFFSPWIAHGQELTRIKQTHLAQSPTAYSLDTENNIFLGFTNGGLQKIPSEGNSTTQPFSLPNQSSITLLEAQNNRKIFLFYRDIQQIFILDRFSAIPKKYDVLTYGIDFAESACISPDGTFWIAENNPQRLKKIDPLRNSILHEVQHNLGDSIAIMRAFGNLLLIADENGFQILDQFGNLNGTINLKEISYFQVLNNLIYITHPKGLVKIDPYKPAIIEELTYEVFLNKKAILKLKNEFAVIDDEKISYFSIPNQKD